MRYTVPAGRDEASYVFLHEKSLRARNWYLGLGYMYPVLMCISLGLYSGVYGFFQTVIYAVILVVFARFQAYQSVRRAPESFLKKAVDASSTEYQEGLQLIEELCQRAGVTWRPKLIVIDSEGFEAYASHPPGRSPYIIISTGAFAFPKKAVRAVVAHELAHMLNGDMTLVERSTVMHIVLTGLLALLMSILLTAFSGYNLEDISFYWFLLILTFIYYRFMLLAINTHSRYREYLADAGAVALIGWENRMDMALALHWTFMAFKEFLKKEVKRRRLYKDFKDPRTGGTPSPGWLDKMQERAIEAIDEMEEKSSVMNTHPTTKERWVALDVTEDEVKEALAKESI